MYKVNKTGIGGSKILLLLMLSFLFFLIPFSSAIENQENTFGTFKINTNVTIINTCTNGSSVCSTCNISSIQNPSSVAITRNQVMSKINNSFLYTVDKSLITVIGQYQVQGVCEVGGQVDTFASSFYVTPTGFLSLTSVYFLMIAVVIFLFIFGFYREDSYSILIAGFILVLLGLFFIIYGIDGYKDITTYSFGIVMTLFASYVITKSAMDLLPR